MEETAATASESNIRHSPSICAGEQKYTSSRKKIILETLQKLHIDCDQDSVPHIALLGSGGGERATVAMLGCTDQLVKEGLFDTLLYTGGVSGSTWAMSSLYSDPHFQTQVEEIISKMFGDRVPLSQIMAWLEGRIDDETFSLTDTWAVVTIAEIMKELEQRHLSEEADRNATNPYPIYSIVERELKSQEPKKGHWFEASPHESGYTELDLFVNTSLLGSKFTAGRLVEVKPEMDMVKLQGICGSALADWEIVIHYLLNLIEEKLKEMTTEILCFIYKAMKHIFKLIRDKIQNPDVLAILDKQQQRLEDMLKHSNSELLETHFLEESGNLSPESTELLLQELEDHCQKLQAANTSILHYLYLLLKLLERLLWLLLQWEWGDTRNFLYHYQGANIPPHLFTERIIYLIDAGLWMNVPYPPFLGHKRDVDLIIAPDFSGEAFESLTLAKEYAEERKKPFPKIDGEILQERNWPKDCYVFEGKGKEPTIIYMPLFNRVNCRDGEEVKKMMKEFRTFQLPYGNDKIKRLLNIARENIQRNKTILHVEIRKAALRKSHRSSK